MDNDDAAVHESNKIVFTEYLLFSLVVKTTYIILCHVRDSTYLEE